jgi:hypothetical protein
MAAEAQVVIAGQIKQRRRAVARASVGLQQARLGWPKAAQAAPSAGGQGLDRLLQLLLPGGLQWRRLLGWWMGPRLPSVIRRWWAHALHSAADGLLCLRRAMFSARHADLGTPASRHAFITPQLHHRITASPHHGTWTSRHDCIPASRHHRITASRHVVLWSAGAFQGSASPRFGHGP